MKLKHNVDSTDLSEAVKEYTIPAQHKVDGVSVPVSPIVVVNPHTSTVGMFVSWDQIPSGLIHTTADPAAGVDFVRATVPAGKRWKVEYMQAVLVTDANVADRYIRDELYASDGTTLLYTSAHTTQQTAGQTLYYDAGPGSAISAPADQRICAWSVAALDEFPAGSMIGFNIYAAPQVGDNWGPLRVYGKEADL